MDKNFIYNNLIFLAEAADSPQEYISYIFSERWTGAFSVRSYQELIISVELNDK